MKRPEKMWRILSSTLPPAEGLFRVTCDVSSSYDTFNLRTDQPYELACDDAVEPAIASRAVIAPLFGSSKTRDVVGSLTTYFSVNRLVHLGDVFAVSLSPNSRLWFKVIALDAVPLEILWLDGAQTRVKCGVISSKFTALLMREAVHSARPGARFADLTLRESFSAPVVPLASGSDHPRTLRPSEPGRWQQVPRFFRQSSDFANRIATALATLRAPLGVQCAKFPSVLLYGDEGCGKRTEVSGAAAFHGLLLSEIDARLLSINEAAGRPSRKQGVTAVDALSENIAAAVEGGRPCLVHVHGVQSLIEGAVGSPSNQASDPHASRFARALEKALDSLQKHWQQGAEAGKEWIEDNSVVLVCSFSVAGAPAASGACNIPRIVRNVFSDEVHLRNPSPASIATFLQRELQASFAIDSKSRATVIDAITGPLVGASWRTVCAFLSYIIDAANDDTESTVADDTVDMIAHDAPRTLSHEAITVAVKRLSVLNPAVADAPCIPCVRYEDIGGCDDAKRAVADMIDLPLRRPDLFRGGVRPRTGMLLWGPPGTGKTLMAKAVATKCKVNFLSVKGPELLNMYVGESERNVRDIFAKARCAAPCVLFFDELDSIGGKGRSADGGAVIERVMAQLLTELDGSSDDTTADAGTGGATYSASTTEGGEWASLLLSRPKLVFFIGATNRPDLLDPSLLRPGRLDNVVYLGVSADPTAKLSVLRALTRKFNLDGDVDLALVADACPAAATGADLGALCSAAMMCAVKRCIVLSQGADAVRSSTVHALARDVSICAPTVPFVSRADFDEALGTFRTSVSHAELASYTALRESFEQTSRAR
jgi:AAA+ superfamily predicted ATPase